MKLTKIKKKNNYQPSQDTPKLPIRRDVCDEFVNLKEATIEGQNMNMTDFVTMVISEFIKNVKIEEVELNMNMTDFVTMVISEFIKNVKIEEVELKGDK